MSKHHSLAAGLSLLAAALVAPSPAHAAESFDACVGYIDALPAVITTQGTWCLRSDLSTGIGSGSAITVQANNVTIDCNHFKLGGLAAGASSGTTGIFANERLNTTVRHCNVRGFFTGIRLDGGGHLAEGNRLDGNLYIGISASGPGNVVRDNQVFDTGGYPTSDNGYGIFAEADVIDNLVDGVFAMATQTYPNGIYLAGSGSLASGNRVRNLVVAGIGNAYGITMNFPGQRADNNHVALEVQTSGVGIFSGGSLNACTRNSVVNFYNGITSCEASLDNIVLGDIN